MQAPSAIAPSEDRGGAGPAHDGSSVRRVSATTTWDAAALVDALVAAAAAVEAQAEGLDRLDEVDDADCGRNLSATMAAVVDAAKRAPLSLGPVLSAVSSVEGTGFAGRLVVALLGGFSEAMAAHDRVDGLRLALALEAGSDRVGELAAVSPGSPICAVALAGATAALARADHDGTLAEVARDAAEAAMDALETTHADAGRQANAGLVDAGAAGWTVVLDALAAAAGAWDDAEHEGADVDPDPFGQRYEVSLALRSLDGSQVERLVAVWSTLGDEVDVVAADDDTWDASVATDDIGAVIEAALAFGRPSRIRVEDRRDSRPTGGAGR